MVAQPVELGIVYHWPRRRIIMVNYRESKKRANSSENLLRQITYSIHTDHSKDTIANTKTLDSVTAKRLCQLLPC